MKKTSMPWLSASVASIGGRVGQLLFFILIGNLYGISAVTDAVFFDYAPVALVAAILANVADAVIIPAVHRAAQSGVKSVFAEKLLWRSTGVVLLVGIIGLGVTGLIRAELNSGVIWLFLLVPVMAARSAVYTGLLNADGRHSVALLGPAYGALGGVIALLALPVSAAGLVAALIIFEASRLFGLWFAYVLRSRSHDTGQHSN
ncbi:MAG: hypothetical protein MJA83_07360, partial [Gammaproteobacteria bacterium]|nr:hypothetical protein [Gammaproteobacteria bacterium]